MLQIKKARIKLLLREPFFGHLALNVAMIENQSQKTMATDGKSIFYNKDFVEKLSDSELIFVLAHEIMHNALLHTFRRGNREPKKWNAACDYVINDTLKQQGFDMPAQGLYDPTYTGMGADEIYKILPDQPEMPRWGTMQDPTKGSNTNDLETEWITNVKQAAEAEKSSGASSPAAKLTAKLSKPKVNWREQLATLKSTIKQTDYAWYPPNLIYLYQGFHIPTLHQPTIGEIVIAVDTSGSIDENLLNRFLAEANALFAHCMPSKVTVLYCDWELQHIQEFTELPLHFEPKGGGGTAFNPVFNYIEEIDESPAALLYFTDLWVSPDDFPKIQPDYPLFWVRTENRSAPYGTYIDLFEER